MKYSNPRTEAIVEDWPHGRKRVTARFFVETNKRGSRVGRVTTGKPKYTTYHNQMVIVDGDDGRIYPVGTTAQGAICVWQGTLKTNEYLYNGEDYQGLLSMMDTPASGVDTNQTPGETNESETDLTEVGQSLSH